MFDATQSDLGKEELFYYDGLPKRLRRVEMKAVSARAEIISRGE